MTAFALGDTLRDKITGFVGVATGRHTFMSGTVQYSLSSIKLDDKGLPGRPVMLDWQHLEYVKAGERPAAPQGLPEFRIGDEVEDSVTDYKGTITSKHEYITGCVQYGVQSPTLNKRGNLAKAQLLDCQRLILRARNEPVAASPGGGPEQMPT